MIDYVMGNEDIRSRMDNMKIGESRLRSSPSGSNIEGVSAEKRGK